MHCQKLLLTSNDKVTVGSSLTLLRALMEPLAAGFSPGIGKKL